MDLALSDDSMFSREDAHVRAADLLMQQLAGDDVLGHMVAEHLAAGGKRLRARLALAAVRALGGDPAAAIGWAAACEMMHNATLVHDDLQDGDQVRRGSPTVWAAHGMVQAINAGDLMLALPVMAVETIPVADGIRWQLSRALAQRIMSVVRGQAYEYNLRVTWNMERDAYLEAVRGKTSGLFELPVEGACLLSGRPSDHIALIVQPFQHLGLLFQLQDDVLDLFGNKGRNAVGNDIREGKISALVVEHVALHPEDRAWLISILEKPRAYTTENDVEYVIEKFRQGGALVGVMGQIQTQHQAALDAINASGEPALEELLRALAALSLRPIGHLLGGR